MSLKNLEIVHHEQDFTEEDDYLQSIRHLSPVDIVDIDGMCQKPRDLKGYSTFGTPAKYEQFVIGTTTVAVVAAYTYYRFLAWEFYYDSVTSAHIADFVERKVKPFLTGDSFGIFVKSNFYR
jgi:hypothetical protein